MEVGVGGGGGGRSWQRRGHTAENQRRGYDRGGGLFHRLFETWNRKGGGIRQAQQNGKTKFGGGGRHGC